MADLFDVTFDELEAPGKGAVLAFVDKDSPFPPTLATMDRRSKGHLKRAAKAAGFSGQAKKSADILAPAGLDVDRITVVGVGEAKKLDETSILELGGRCYGLVAGQNVPALTIIAELKDKTLDGGAVADLVLGMMLRAYKDERFKSQATKGNGKEEEKKKRLTSVRVLCKSPKSAERHMKAHQAIAEGVSIARDLVNAPANILGPVEFADVATELRDLGVEVMILDDDALEKLGMGSLLSVGQGSVRPSRVAIMRWSGAKSEKNQPVAFIGKGVVFDTGGISLKPAKGMEDMKGDMGGAACVVGLMHALAKRGAKANVVGAIGLVENMPGANAQRPGDIVTSLSGQTIEVLNTDAEGRLVLADLLWHVKDEFKPKFMIDLATLTGAIIVALGKEHAGLFSNDDELAEQLHEAGQATGEKVWRLPLTDAYDKLIDSKNADMKNIGGPQAGSITAAQFLQRFVEDVPWAHLDIAGTGMAAKQSEINRSWGSGFGVRLLDRLVADHYEE
ncbi:MAG: leucyl aminopeptidase [Hyphomicrobiaceae bacterium]